MWVIHRGLLLRLPWRTYVYSSECQVWRWCSCLGQGPGSTRYQGSWQQGQWEIRCSRRVWQPTPVFLPGESPRKRSLAGHSPQGLKELDTPEVILHVQTQDFFLACGSSAPVRIECEGVTAAWVAGTLVAPSMQGHGLPQPQKVWPFKVFFQPLAAGDQRHLWIVLFRCSARSGT